MNSKVLLLSNMYPSSGDPTYGVFVKNIADSLQERGIAVELCVIKGREKNKLIKLYKYFVFVVKALNKLAFTRNKVYVHYVAHSALPVILACYFKKLEVIAHVHGGDVIQASHQLKLISEIKYKLSSKLLNLAQTVIVPSYYFRQYLETKFAIPDEKLFVSPSGGVDLTVFRFNKGKRGDSLRGKLYGYVGRLDEGKGLATLLEAFFKHVKDYPDSRLEIIGDGTLRKTLMTKVESHGSHAVTFLGPKTQYELAELYSKFDFLVFPSELIESLGLVGLEAMASGTPVIGTAMGGMQDYLKDHLNGLKFSAGGVESLNEAFHIAENMAVEQYEKLSQSAHEEACLYSDLLASEQLAKLF